MPHSPAYTELMSVLANRGPNTSGQPPGIDQLVENHRAFLRYLQRRVSSREIAEDILQDAFVRNLGRAGSIADEALIPWFYRVLRNAVVDHYRRRGAAAGALERFAREIESQPEAPEDVHREICACVSRLAAALKPEYTEALQAIELESIPVASFAARKGISASTAGVRIFRARQALKRQVVTSCGTCAEHGCRDCTCGHHTSAT